MPILSNCFFLLYKSPSFCIFYLVSLCYLIMSALEQIGAGGILKFQIDYGFFRLLSQDLEFFSSKDGFFFKWFFKLTCESSYWISVSVLKSKFLSSLSALILDSRCEMRIYLFSSSYYFIQQQDQKQQYTISSRLILHKQFNTISFRLLQLQLFQQIHWSLNSMNVFIFKIIRMQQEHPQPNLLLLPQQQPQNARTLESSEIKQTQADKPSQRLTFTVADSKGKNSALPQVLSSTSHPIIAGLHILIKIGVVFIYLILPFLTNTFNVLAAVVLAAAMDFWIVKNISGRFLVGLKWWIDFSEDGEQQWRFQCKVNQKDSTLADQRAFWWALIIFSLVWVVFSVINVFKSDVVQVTICIFCFTLLFFNLHSFYRCSNMQKQNVNRLFSIYGGKKAAQFISGSIISSFR